MGAGWHRKMSPHFIINRESRIVVITWEIWKKRSFWNEIPIFRWLVYQRDKVSGMPNFNYTYSNVLWLETFFWISYAMTMAIKMHKWVSVCAKRDKQNRAKQFENRIKWNYLCIGMCVLSYTMPFAIESFYYYYIYIIHYAWMEDRAFHICRMLKSRVYIYICHVCVCEYMCASHAPWLLLNVKGVE